MYKMYLFHHQFMTLSVKERWKLCGTSVLGAPQQLAGQFEKKNTPRLGGFGEFFQTGRKNHQPYIT